MAATNACEATIYAVERGAAWITLNRPEQRNALSATLVNELAAHLASAIEDAAVRCIVVTGAGPGFCAGADLKSPPGQMVSGQRGVSLAEVLMRMMDSPKPVIAMVNGAAFAGGLGLVGAADIVVVAAEAPMSFSEVRIGVIPAVISVACLPKLGSHHGMKLFLTGERFSGARAVEVGLAHRAVPLADLRGAVQQEIDAIALGGPTAVAECKKLVRRMLQLPRDEAFREAAEWSVRMFQSPEGAEGIAAFREKRPPAWVRQDDSDG